MGANGLSSVRSPRARVAMAQIFHRSTNTIARVSIFGAVFIVAGLLWLFAQIHRSPWITDAQVAREQPIQFSHERHVAGNGIDCRYCHTSVEDSPFAGIPPTKTCMNCHSRDLRQQPVPGAGARQLRDRPRRSSGRASTICPDFVYFDHSIHVNKGVGCTTCHGPVDRMPLMWQEQSLQMEWCLDCHRKPSATSGRATPVFSRRLPAAGQPARARRQLVAEYQIQKLTSCSTCHQ